jgi:hypothetical protein
MATSARPDTSVGSFRRITRYNPKLAKMYGDVGDAIIGIPARVLYRPDREYDAVGRMAVSRKRHCCAITGQTWRPTLIAVSPTLMFVGEQRATAKGRVLVE